MLLESQQCHLQQVLEGRDVEFKKRFTRMDERMDKHEEQVTEIRKLVEDLARARSDGGSTGYGDSADRHRMTLVWGGWPRESRRQAVLQPHLVLNRLQVRSLLDADPWTTGPRRGVALANFSWRPGEAEHEVRKRMHQVVVKFANSDALLQGRRIWCFFSQTPEERRASHASLIKRTVQRIAKEATDDLDIEYQTGTVWLGERAALQSTQRGMRLRPTITWWTASRKSRGSTFPLAKELRLDLKTVRQGILAEPR